MDIVIISLAAFFISILTFFSGFGLGTLLTPVFMLFFPVELAIALTGVVHFFNNIFKLFIAGKNADKETLLKFGIPAVLFAIAGAWLLGIISNSEPLFSYMLNEKQIDVYPVKFIIACLLIIFALMELIPFLRNIHFSKKHLFLGGALSGFFGGLSGNQGALRSAFLIKAGLTKEVFIATSIVIACFVDFTRLIVYSSRFMDSAAEVKYPVLISATLTAIAGAFIGNKLMKKVTLKTIQVIVGLLLIMVSIGLGSGLL